MSSLFKTKRSVFQTHIYNTYYWLIRLLVNILFCVAVGVLFILLPKGVIPYVLLITGAIGLCLINLVLDYKEVVNRVGDRDV